MKTKNTQAAVEIPISAPCKFCGCTNDRACPGGCYWYDKDVCSACAIKQRLIKVKRRRA